MINPIKSILPVTLIAIASSGCQAPSSPPPQSQRPTEPPALFVEAEFAAYDGAGNSTISGQAFLRTRGGEVRVGAGQQVQLYPVTSYTTQKVRALMATDGDVAALLYSIPFEPRAEKYRKSTIADAAGNFEFRRLPAGDYYVVCLITWEVPGRFGVETSGGVAYSRVAVAAGETAKAVVTK